jgi:hypothetical protein
MLLIIVLGLIAKLALVSWACENETSPLTDFDWSRVGISVLTCLLLSAAVKTYDWFYISFVFPFTKSQYSVSDCTRIIE